MINWLDSSIQLHTLIWLFLATFMIHDFEEIIWVESWMQNHFETLYAKVPQMFKRDVASFRGIKSSHFAVPVAMEFLFFIPVSWAASDFHHYLFFIGVNLILFLHVFTHLGQSLLLRLYTPGVVTALLVVLPYSLYLFHRLGQLGILNGGTLLISLLLGVPLVPLILLGHKLGRKLIPDS